MNQEHTFTLKTIIIAGIIAIIAFLAFGGVCLSVGYDHGKEDAENEFAAMEINVEPEPEVDEVEEIVVEPEDIEPQIYHVATEKDPLNLWDEPLQEAESIGQVPRGTTIEIYEVNDHWGFTEYNGVEGWVNLDYCKEGVADPDDFVEDVEMVWVVMTDGAYAYHNSSCHHKNHSLAKEVTLEEAEAMGRTPCGKCGG